MINSQRYMVLNPKDGNQNQPLWYRNSSYTVTLY